MISDVVDFRRLKWPASRIPMRAWICRSRAGCSFLLAFFKIIRRFCWRPTVSLTRHLIQAGFQMSLSCICSPNSCSGYQKNAAYCNGGVQLLTDSYLNQHKLRLDLMAFGSCTRSDLTPKYTHTRRDWALV